MRLTWAVQHMCNRVLLFRHAGFAATPAPCDHHPLPDLPRGPAWTLAGKTATSSALAASSSAAGQPGPGHYTLPDPQGSGPAFSITGKPGKVEVAAAVGIAANEPGPGAYFAPKGKTESC
jgi:hypothetical protein